MDTIVQITQRFKQIQFNIQRQNRFKFCLRDEETFNSSVYVDEFHISGHFLLNFVDEDTRFGAVLELNSVPSEAV